MSKPILIPKNILVFKHPHLLGPADFPSEAPPPYADVLYCVTERPHVDIEVLPLLGEVVRDITPCGQEIYWRLK
ncbi:hypothetical protein LCGC14_1740270 [marine sediment metagenome]|uniref:Uncharacterized protein n=1 Tax=marine sediment metagenome TaxID=412755 RepID=A0A0F9K6M0_9ZZZZ